MGEFIYAGLVIAIVVGIKESVKWGCRHYLNGAKAKKPKIA